MNVLERSVVTPKVTTGPIAGSRKIYVAPEAAPDLRVPLREVVLTEAAARAAGADLRSVRPLYRCAGRRSTSRRASPRTRIEWVRERGGVEEYEGRNVKPEDNGNVGDKHARAHVSRPATGRCARSPASRSPSSNGRAPASSPRR